MLIMSFSSSYARSTDLPHLARLIDVRISTYLHIRSVVIYLIHQAYEVVLGFQSSNELRVLLRSARPPHLGSIVILPD